MLLRLVSTSLLLVGSLTPRMTLSVAWLPGNRAATVKEFWGMFRQQHTRGGGKVCVCVCGSSVCENLLLIF